MLKRIMVVNKERCNPIGCGGHLCMKVSPSNRAGKAAIIQSADGKVEINESLLSDADIIAAHKCPFQALEMIKLPAELNQEPIHRYSKNGFSLYSLPTPIFGKVVGIVGRNGIGKSTAIKILAGLIKPNFGNTESKKESTDDDIIKYFKGTEAQAFFEKRKSGNIKIGYKPQGVEQIPKAFSGTVKELLKKVDEKGIYESIILDLDLTNILNNEIKSISGGELQRVAIAATVMKKANLYIFDEPTSYLDIKQRIKISKFLQKLPDDNTAVIVIEHDLIILDYMTDLVHLMYGREDAYGIVSMIKTTKAGINTYLDGYIREENMRFRENKITFTKKPADEGKEGTDTLITSWDDIKKELGNFKLEAKQGEIHENQVIGILGENGIGKTSFVKMLAGLIKPDKGKINKKITVSYKPQYIEPSDELVITVLQEAMVKYSNNLIKALNLEMLFEKKLNELSGGQLQRVSIAACLGKDADLYLLDEPSAYLDVEQRLLAAKVIRDMMDIRAKSALIVDHDILFIDYLSDKLMVFDGIPAKNGEANGPYTMLNGMNLFLEKLIITMRRDSENNRPRINDEGSQMDRKQRSEGKLYYG